MTGRLEGGVMGGEGGELGHRIWEVEWWTKGYKNPDLKLPKRVIFSVIFS